MRDCWNPASAVPGPDAVPPRSPGTSAQTDWIVSGVGFSGNGARRCDAETYQVLTEAAYELSERLPALFPQPDRQTVRLQDVSDCICSMAAAIGCVAQEEPTRDGDTDRGSEPAGFLPPPARPGGVPAVRTVAGMAHGGGRRKLGPSRSTPRAPDHRDAVRPAGYGGWGDTSAVRHGRSARPPAC